MVIELTSGSHEANFCLAAEEGLQYLFGALTLSPADHEIYNRCMFTEAHLEKIFPLMTKHNIYEKMIEEGMEDVFCIGGDDEGGEVLDKPEMAKHFVAYSSNEQNLMILENCIAHLELSGSKCNANGTYYGNKYEGYRGDQGSSVWAGERHPIHFAIKFNSRDTSREKRERLGNRQVQGRC
jgi:hypothetical protein